jgi:hypothetical protein
VATEMLAARGIRMTNRERKAYQDARATVWCAEQARKPLLEKMANRARQRAIKWLAREQQRASRQRRGVQRKYESLLRLERTPVIERFLAALDLRAGHLDTVLDAITAEVQHRKDLTQGRIGNKAPGRIGGNYLLLCPQTRRFFVWEESRRAGARTIPARWVVPVHVPSWESFFNRLGR